jgi:hypothetical protein
MKGGAYGGEDIAIDLAQGAAEALVAALTAGAGEAAIKLLARSPALAGLARLAEGGVVSRVTGKALESGIEGMVQGLPSGMMSAILNEETWRSPNPLLSILEAGGMASAQGAGMGVVMGGVMTGAHELAGAGHAPAAHGGEPSVRGGHAEAPAAGPHAEAPAAGPHAEAPAAGPHAEAPAAEPHAEAPAAEPHPEAPAAEPHAESGAPSERSPEAVPPAAEEAPARRASPGEKVPERPVSEPLSIDDIPEIELPDGSIMYGGDPPMSHADAQQMYERTIAETPNREAIILENVETGERIVIQGNENVSGASPDVWAEFAAEQLNRGRWKGVKHNHPVGEGGVTPMHERFPSGAGGDLAAAAQDAIAAGKPHSESIDVTTETGPQEIHYGYDPASESPYWVDVPGPDGARIKESFGSIEDYHAWFEKQTGLQMATIGEPSTGTRALPDTAPAERATPKDAKPKTTTESPGPAGDRAELPEGVKRGSLRDRAMELINELPRGQRETLMDRLRGMHPDDAGEFLSRLGKLASPEGLAEGMRTRTEVPSAAPKEASGPFASGEQLTEHLAEVSGEMLDVPDGRTRPAGDSTEPHAEVAEPYEGLGTVERRPPPRTSPDKPGVDRSALRNRMEAPTWAAGDPQAWDAHHIFPVETHNHEVFEVLRNTPQGWDVNAEERGIALPRRPGIKGAEGLPVHQVNREVIVDARRQAAEARKALGLPELPQGPMPNAQTMKDLAGHPVTNAEAKAELDKLAGMHLSDLGPDRLKQLGVRNRDLNSRLIDHPDLLREEVLRLERRLTKTGGVQF